MAQVRRALIAAVAAAVAVLAVCSARAAGLDSAPKAVVSTDGFVRVVAYDNPRDEVGFRRPILAFAGNLIDSIARAFDIKREKVGAPGLIIYAMDGRTNDTRVVVRPETRRDGSKVVKIFLPSPGYSDLDELSLAIAKAFAGSDIPDWLSRGILRCIDAESRRIDTRAVLELWSSGNLPGFRSLCTGDEAGGKISVEIAGYMAGWIRERKLLGEIRKQGWSGARMAEALTGEKSPALQDRASDERLVRLARSVLEPGECGKWELDFFSSKLLLRSPFFDTKLIGGKSVCTFNEAIAAGESNLLVRAAAFLKSREITLYALGRGDGLKAAAAGYTRFLLGIAAGEDREKLEKMLKEADSKLEAEYEKNSKDDNR